MLQQLISHSPDIKSLWDEGYDLEVNGAYLLVHEIPYLIQTKEIRFGTLVTVLTLSSPTKTASPQDHTVYFRGQLPCDALGNPLLSIINSSGNQQLTDSILINHYFSSKPISGNYQNFYDKIRTYAQILTAEASAIDPSVSCRPKRKERTAATSTPFRYPDTNSARANIDFLNSKFSNQKIGIIGLGGTGSYILDLVSKTPVGEINVYDGDVFHLHNAFRAPGAISGKQLEENNNLSKVAYFESIYSHMHSGIKAHQGFITENNIQDLSGLDFVFICVDSNPVRHAISTALLRFGISFIDVGLGVNIVDEKLIGSIRITASSDKKNDHLASRIGQDDQEGNDYAKNIQIADLNCLNAVLAVIKWKKMIGYYQDLKNEHNTLYFINTGKLLNDDAAA